ncbi:hypothetical protein BDZ89DRAFT_202092 [Hymenopellis radicata]|nr:hypothetical protein BDZ89DRAFT_202092 [Hymenopellis radicata]
MDHTSDMEQDIVADSEGEEESLQLPSLGSPVLNVYNSPIILSPKRPAKDDVSSVSDFTRGTSNKDDISAFTETPLHAPKPRPKPRPTGNTRNKATPPSDIQDGSLFTSGDAAFPGILGIADRAKMRSRRVTQAKPKADIIDISSDDDELSMPSSALNGTSSAKQRPKPKPRRSAAGSANASSSSSHSPPSLGPSHVPGASSHVQHPTIAVLPEPNTSIDLPSPLTSPLPLPPKKRKRPSVVEDDDIPGLPFFASSSAESLPRPPQALPAKQPKKKAQKRNEDDEEFGSAPVTAPKPRRKNKDDEEFGAAQSPKPKKKTQN